jgi:membrane carboxypeptidase/penicillin-binding protein PbpC
MLNNINTVLAAEIIEEKATFTIISVSQNKVTLKVQNYTSQEATLFWGNGDQLSLEQGEGLISYTYSNTGNYTIKLTDGKNVIGQGVQISYLNETEFGKPAVMRLVLPGQ